MVVEEAAGLHQRVGCRRTAETEAARLEFFCDDPAQWRFRRHLRHAREAILGGFAVYKAPKEARQRLAFRQIKVGARVCNGRFDLATVADDARVGQQFSDFPFVVACNALRLESVEGFAEPSRLRRMVSQDRPD